MFGAGKSSAGINVNETNALTYSAVWACLRIVSQTIGCVPWRVFRRDGDARILDESNPVDFLLHHEPNEDMTSQSFREAMQAMVMLFGNAYAEILRDRMGNVVSIGVPIHPERVEIKRNDSGRLVYEVSAENGVGESVLLPASSVFHIKNMSGNGLVGYFTMLIAKESFGHGMALDRFGATWFGNGSRPSGIIKTTSKLNDKSLENIRRSFSEQYGGPSNWNKVGILEGGEWDWVNTSVPPEAAQFLQSRTFQITELSRWFGVPPHMLAELSRATFSNIESQRIEYVQDAVLPWACRWEGEANRKLFDRSERGDVFTKLNLRGLMRGDSTARGQWYTTMSGLGAFSVNEIRGFEDMNPIGEEGDLRLVDMNRVPLEDAEDVALGRVGAGPGEPEPAGNDNRAETYKLAAARVIHDGAQRAANVECDRVESAGTKYKTQKGFDGWADSFFKRHAELLCRNLSPGIDALIDLISTDRPADTCKSAHGALKSYVVRECESASEAAKTAYAEGTIDDLCELRRAAWAPGVASDLTEYVVAAILEVSK